MKTCSILMLAMLLGASSGAAGQIASGNIYGTVVDDSGGVLPGAVVTLEAPVIGGAPRATTTGNQGEFRFLNLDNATYKLTVSMPGFTRVERDIIVNTGTNITVDFNLKVASVEETVLVTTETPVLDTRKVGTSTTLTTDELAAVPNGRDPWVVLQSIPGVIVDRVNIAGNESGQQSSFAGKGAAAADSMWTLDGVVITDTTSSGASSMYFDYDAFDEIAVNTGGNDLQVQTGGIGLNFVTKRGTNAFHGSVRGFLAHDNLQSSNLPAALENDSRLQLPDGSFNDKADHIERNLETGFDVGGPIVRDKLWFWGSYGYTDLRIVRLTQTKDRTVLKNYNAKVNWQPTLKDQFSFFFFNGGKEKYGRSPGQASNEANSFLWNQGTFYPEDGALSPLKGLWKWEDNHVFTNNFFMNAKYAYFGWGYGFSPIGGEDQDGGVDLLSDRAFGSWFKFTARKPWHILDVSASAFKAAGGGNHEFKFGFGYRSNPNKTTTTWSGSQVVGFRNSATDSVAWVTRQRSVAFKGTNTSAFVGDTFTRGPLTVNAGVRWDRQTSENQASTALGNPTFPDLLPTLTYEGGGPSIEWNDISPRVGVNYAIGEAGKTVARVSYARYGGQLNPFEITSISPVGGYYTFVAYNWNDANGDHLAQRNEVLTNLGPQYANNVDPANPSSAEAVNLLDPDYHSNQDHELIVGIDHELAPNVGLSAAYTWRRSNEWPTWNPRIGLTRDDYIRNRAEHANGFTAISFSPDPDAVAASAGGRILTNRPDYHTTYGGLELSLNKRLSNRWMGRAAISVMDWREYFDGRGAASNPTPTDWTGSPAGAFSGPLVEGGQVAPRSYGAKRNVFFNARWQVNANAMYELAHGFQVAGNIFTRQGYPMPIVLNVDGGDDGNLTALGTPGIDTRRNPTVWNLDLRLSKKFELRRGASLDILADVFNATNNGIVLERNRFANSDAFNQINEVISPRIFRLGVRFLF